MGTVVGVLVKASLGTEMDVVVVDDALLEVVLEMISDVVSSGRVSFARRLMDPSSFKKKPRLSAQQVGSLTQQ